MAENNRRRRPPQHPSGSNELPKQQESVSGPLVVVEAADAAAFVGQVEPIKGKSRLPFDSPNWITVEYVYQSLCKLPRYIGYPSSAAEDFEAKVRNGDVPAMRRCFLYDRNQTLPGPEYELLERSHWDEHKFFVRDGRLEVDEGTFIYRAVRGYAYFVWKPAVAKHWPGVFASTPPSPGDSATDHTQERRKRGPKKNQGWKLVVAGHAYNFRQTHGAIPAAGKLAELCDPETGYLPDVSAINKLIRDLLGD